MPPVLSVSPALLDQLVDEAKLVRARAYAPYSKYSVGAALATAGGRIYTGCNVENASYGATICAERSAIAQMIASGDDKPVACAVATGGTTPGSPCGICRQVLVEFSRDMPVVLVSVTDDGREIRRDTSLSALLPDAFVSF
ncbi:cytidine deaminase [Pendulispora brunnea]|uniref:Cytidine deaminase n=1 Tax=Pendulispora brunnea TaxID=2905690 RepID=A0ABZ2K8V2_9BACT